MFSSVMGEDLAKHGGVGLAEFIYQHMKKMMCKTLTCLHKIG